MFTGKTVVVTGAAQGIGRGITAQYAKTAANVVIADTNELGAQLAEELRADGYSALFIQTDVRDEESIRHLMEQTVQHFGSLDILINNAGKAVFKSLFELSLDEWEDVIHTNLRSVFLCTKEAAKHMQGGAIVNIASTRAVMSEPNTEAYAATKGGIIALTHALAASLSPLNITVNSISPGWIETVDYSALRDKDHAQHFSGRVGTPEDIARACLYLTQEGNNFVTATNITIDGGMTKKMIYEE